MSTVIKCMNLNDKLLEVVEPTGYNNASATHDKAVVSSSLVVEIFLQYLDWIKHFCY